MSTIVVRYTPKPDQADTNQRLIEAVFAELNQTNPEGLRYASLRLGDGTFLHIADVDAEQNPLSNSAAFARFQNGIADRCIADGRPNPQVATLIGSFHMFESSD